jgi:membrane-bound metal-dependent hydrolase YbcI (DUF457 family)
MDLFTHVIFAYLLSFALTGGQAPVYIAAGALAGGLPDSDILVFPLARRFPLLAHHGITHSILGVTGFAVAGALLGPLIVPGTSPLFLLLFMELGGLSHLVTDGLTNFAVPPFAPFSDVQVHLDTDRPISLFTLPLSIASLVILLSERGTVPIPVWVDTAWALLAIYVGYIAARAFGRWKAGRASKAEGYTAVVPTGNPFSWLLVDEKERPGSWQMRFARYGVRKGTYSPQQNISLSTAGAGTGPVRSAEEAIERSYKPSMAASRFLAISYRYALVKGEGDKYEVHWFSIEWLIMGRAPGVLATVDAATGAVKVRSSWFDFRTLGQSLAHDL